MNIPVAQNFHQDLLADFSRQYEQWRIHVVIVNADSSSSACFSLLHEKNKGIGIIPLDQILILGLRNSNTFDRSFRQFR